MLKMRPTTSFLVLLQFLSATSLSVETTRSRLTEAFSSPSGKLTFSPEIVIPEPNDPTAILLQTNAVQTLSQRIRACKANAAFIQGSVNSLKIFSAEQEQARGSFPGPVPTIFCWSGDDDDMSDIAAAGAEGILIRVCNGQEVPNIEAVASDQTWTDACKSAIQVGIQPIPEVTVGETVAGEWNENDVQALIESISSSMGSDPVAILLTVNPNDKEQEQPVALPTFPKALNKKVPILGSLRAKAGESRISIESGRYKENGFGGCLLRSDCVPGFRMQLDLEIVGNFWAACIDDLKSTKSKSFSFRSKNNMEKSTASMWGALQKSVIESGALGDPNETTSIVDTAAGDYQGFA